MRHARGKKECVDAYALGPKGPGTNFCCSKGWSDQLSCCGKILFKEITGLSKCCLSNFLFSHVVLSCLFSIFWFAFLFVNSLFANSCSRYRLLGPSAFACLCRIGLPFFLLPPAPPPISCSSFPSLTSRLPAVAALPAVLGRSLGVFGSVFGRLGVALGPFVHVLYVLILGRFF